MNECKKNYSLNDGLSDNVLNGDADVFLTKQSRKGKESDSLEVLNKKIRDIGLSSFLDSWK